MIIRALKISFYLMSLLFFISQADAGEKLLEDWNSISALDAVWGRSDIHDQHIHVMDGELHHLLRPYSTISTSNNLTTFNAFPLSTANNISAFQAKIRIEAIGDISLAPEIELAATDFFGMYYNINTEPTDGVGDIYFVARFGDRGNGLEAWYFLTRIDASDSSAETNLATGNFIPPVGGWQIATDYILSVTYDGANTFVATFGGQPTDISPVVGPARGSSASWAGKSIRTRVRLNGPFTGDADAFAIHTVFDDVHIDTGEGLTLHDDFNADQSLSTSRWDSTTLVRQSEVTDEMLKMRLKVAEADTVADNGFRYTVGLPPEYQNTDFLQADMKIAGNAMQDAARARVAVGGIFGNGKYTEPGHGTDGVIQFNANVEKKAGSADYRVICNAYMEGLTLEDEVYIMWEHVPALPDTWYTATLAITGNTLQCQIKDTTTGDVVLSASKDVTTLGIASIAPLGETRELFVRDIFAPGEVIGYYDNIYVKDGKGGDINQDEAVDLTDAILALQIVAGLNPAIPRLAFGTDVDGDNKIGLAEAIYALQAAAQLIDTIPPTIIAGPTLSATTAYGTTLSVTINENGTGHYLIQPAAEPAPTPAQVAARTGIAMTANVPAMFNISGLTESTEYKAYFVAKDLQGNTQTAMQQAGCTSLQRPSWLPENFFSQGRPIICTRGTSQTDYTCAITCRQYHDDENTLIWKQWQRGVWANKPSNPQIPYFQGNEYQIIDANGLIEKTYFAVVHRQRRPNDSPVLFPGGYYSESIGGNFEVDGVTDLPIGYEPDWGCTAGSSYLMVRRGTSPTVYTYDPPGYSDSDLNCGSMYNCNSRLCYDLPSVSFNKFLAFAMDEDGPSHANQYTLDNCSDMGCSEECIQENWDTSMY